MLEHYPKFDAYLNRFNTHLKEMTAQHVKYIRRMGEWQQSLRVATQDFLHQIQVGVKHLELQDQQDKIATLLTYGAIGLQLEKSQKVFEGIFKQHIEQTNQLFGSYSSHWGGYIESVGVAQTLQYLRKHHEVHTSLERFSRKQFKERVTIDLIALSERHCFVVDVKNQLKVEHLVALEKNLQKLRSLAPEYHSLIMQPVMVCFHADPVMIAYVSAHPTVWVLRYHGFEQEHPQNRFSWLHGG